ncbi:LysM peptidoglycan-binding domain-containing protein [Echinicola pacifica]|uniref:LysM peptidoglycan-binding domain-containing protein n=1 Tax=Echinicola pacifica TaxID=346377 RepID=UPI00037293E2|nr:LysM peptidoglycan-binding domain-containing protein [Echinicola pacifica]
MNKTISPPFPPLFIALFLLFAHSAVWAQAPRVPSTIYFADLTLQLNAQAQKDIQLDVDALYRNPEYFQVKLDRVNLYMPIIERVLEESGAPSDLKYLVIQESGLIPDAVSTSNAVGFWQFKRETAHEVFMQVDHHIDERKNIVSSTQGAAAYLGKHNSYLDNWLCATVSYQMGLGGAQRYFGSQYKGHKTMKITASTHWYFKKFLAHKIAFESQLGKSNYSTHLAEISVQGPTDLRELAKNLGVSETHLEEYNKWVLKRKIPEGKTYSLTYLASGAPDWSPSVASNTAPQPGPVKVSTPSPPITSSGYPKVSGSQTAPFEKNQIKINGIKGIIAAATTSQEDFAERIGIGDGKLRRVNDLPKNVSIQKGKLYYTKRKKSKGPVPYHVVHSGETLWAISQMYGIRLHSLKAKNRLYKDEDLKQGMVLNLQDYRGKNESIAYQNTSAPTRPSSTQPSNNPRPTTPSSTPANTSQRMHTVSKGETLYSISKKYSVSVNDIIEWNRLKNASMIQVGQQLIIKKP